MVRDFTALPIDGWANPLFDIVLRASTSVARWLTDSDRLTGFDMPSGLAILIACAVLGWGYLTQAVGLAKLMLDGWDVIGKIRQWLDRGHDRPPPPPPPPPSSAPAKVADLPSRRVRQSGRAIARLHGWDLIEGGASSLSGGGPARTRREEIVARQRLTADRCKRERCLLHALIAEERRSLAMIRDGCVNSIRIVEPCAAIACPLIDLAGVRHQTAKEGDPFLVPDALLWRMPIVVLRSTVEGARRDH